MDEGIRVLSLVALEGRCTDSSTEIFFQAEKDMEEVFVELWGRGSLIGYARFALSRSAD